MLDPEEQDWICDPCSTDGWAGTTSAWKLRRGHVVSLKHERHLVLAVDEVGRFIGVETLDPNGAFVLRFMRATKRVYVHEQGDYERATKLVRDKAKLLAKRRERLGS
jgi:hypothetical protein